MKVIIVLLALLTLSCSDNRRIEDQVGTYIIDLERTNLGSYILDKEKYSKLTITFKEDLTFNCNMEVPFIFSKSGKWEIGTYDEYELNYLIYEGCDFKDQFYQCCLDDSTFLMNSITPRQGYRPVNKIYFKKINLE